MSTTSSSLTGSIQLDQFEDHFGNAAEIHLCLIRSEQQPSIYNSDALRSRGTHLNHKKESIQYREQFLESSPSAGRCRRCLATS